MKIALLDFTEEDTTENDIDTDKTIEPEQEIEFVKPEDLKVNEVFEEGQKLERKAELKENSNG